MYGGYGYGGMDGCGCAPVVSPCDGFGYGYGGLGYGGFGYGGYGYGGGCGGGFGGGFAIIIVLFILLVIIGTSFFC